MKRDLDLVGGLLALVVLSPLLLVIAALNKLQGRGPVLVRSEKMGRHFRRFWLLGFRTTKLRGFGLFLRAWRLDGIPRLINVLRGEMSLVGPSPAAPKEVEAFRGDYEEILQVLPGIIDPVAIRSGGSRRFRNGSGSGAEDDNQILPERIRAWKSYARSMSLRGDLGIILEAGTLILRRSVVTPVLCTIDRWVARVSPYRLPIVILIQTVLVALSAYLAFLVRFEGQITPEVGPVLLRSLPWLIVVRLAAFLPFGLFAGLWRYASVRDLRNIAGSVVLGTAVFAWLREPVLGIRGYPTSVLLIDTLILFFLLTAIRLFKRLLWSLGAEESRGCRVLIVGAGDAGESLVREMKMHPDHGYVPIGFIDDDPAKRGTTIRGVRVLGGRRDLERIVRGRRSELILIAIPSARTEVLLEVVRDCRVTGLPVKILPGLRDLLGKAVLLDAIQDVEPEDLLCRPPVIAPSPELEAFYQDRTLLVTGAGGSIGSELVRQIAAFGPSELVLYERHEHSLYQIERELRRAYPHLPLVPVIGDILDAPRMAAVFAEHRPTVVFHAAAYKHVPMMELNPHEAVKVNVIGTRTVARVAMEAKVERFLLISTDKAVKPSSVMGATKRVAEQMLQDIAVEGRTKFMIVRFGNVLGSSGSVVPLFKEQIRRGGPVTVTHPEMSRFFMTTAEAVHLVLHAALLGEGGEIFVLDMGAPIRVLEMARQLISLYGLKPGRDIPIVFTGLRPGEKLHEELFNPGEIVRATRHPKIRVALNGHGPKVWADLEILLGEDAAGGDMSRDELKRMLSSVNG